MIAARPELIYCADGNKRYAQIAIEAGFIYGARLPGCVYFPPEFVDQEWENPNREKYMAALAKWRPRLATVLDWEQWEQLPEVLSWAEEAAKYVKETVLIIPKVRGGIEVLRNELGEEGKINNTPIRLAFSYDTGFSHADYSILDEMIGWPNGIHILGGPPHAPRALYEGRLKRRKRKTPPPDLFTRMLDIRSIDGNYILKLANKGLVWSGNSVNFKHRSIREVNKGKRMKKDANYRAFELSCKNIMEMWNNA